MKAEVTRADIGNLRVVRTKAARANHELVGLEIERKRKQVEIAAEYGAKENPATGKPFSEQASSDLARTDERYTRLLDVIANKTRERDLLVAEAEALKLSVELDVALLRGEPAGVGA
jgi:hypothetical protein